MRKVLWTSQVLTLALAVATASAAPALAQDVYNLNQNETGFNLPGVTLPQGQDEVHAADGTTCRSAVSGSGAYLDLGVIRGNNQSNNDVATYGRVVIPIGRTPKRLDCSRLYELEVQRLQMELKLLKMGVNVDGGTTASVATTAPAAASPGWANEGWSLRTGNGDGKKRGRRNSRALLAVAALAGFCLPVQAAIIGTCTIMVGASGKMTANPAISILGSKQAGGSSASATVVANSLLCSILNLLDCYSVSAPAPAAFSSAPSGGGTNVTFASVFRLDGSGVDVNGSVPQRVVNGTHPMQVDLTATKSSGIFPAGNYQGTVTVRCE